MDITESKLKEEQFFENEKMQSAFFENIFAPMLIIDPDTSRIIDANDTACSFYGWNRKKITKMKIGEINTLSEKEIAAEMQNARSMKRNTFCFKHRTANGTIKDVEVFSGPVTLKNKSVLYSIIKDISERKLMEEDLLRMKFSIEKAKDAIFWIDEDAKIEYVNESACKALEYTKEELMNLSLFDIDPLFPKEKWKEHWDKTRTIQSYKIESKHKTKSGKIFPVEVSIDMFNYAGKEYHASFVRDITERINFEKKLVEKEHRMANIIDFLPDATFVVDLSGKIIAWNKAIEEMTGFDKSKMLGKGGQQYSTAFYHEARPMLIDYILEKSNDILKLYDFVHIQGNRIYSEVYNPHFYNGKGVFLWATAAPLFDNSGNRVGAIESIRDITERKRAEQALAESEKKYRSLVGSLPDTVIVHIDGIIKYVNTTGDKTMFGYTAEEIINSSMLNYVHPDDREQVIKNTELRKKSGSAVNFYELRLISKSSEITNVEVRVSNIEYEGTPATLVVVTDITGKKKIENELRASEDKFSKAFHTSPDAVNITRLRDGIYLETNEGFTDATGYAKEEIVGTSSLDLNIWVNPNDRKKLINELREKGEVNNLEAPFKMKNGEIKTALMSARLIELNGEICVLSIARDISDRKKAQEALLKSEAMLQSLVNSLPQNIFCKDLDGRFTFVNENFCTTLGKTSEEILGKTDFDFVPHELAEKFRKDDKKVMKTDSIIDNDETHEQLNGKKQYVHVIKSPLYDLKGKLKGILGFFWDITESKKAEEELIRAKNKAEISEQMKSAFLAQMSHEIRSPLYRILGYVSLIKDYVENPQDHDAKEALDYFDSIDLSSKRLIRTIDSILNMSEIQTNSYMAAFNNIDMYEILNNLYREYLVQAAAKNLNFELTALTENTFIYCDEYSVTQIFANLIDNALKYTNSGKVNIIIGQDQDKRLYVEVVDNGIGISQEFMQQLFAPFTQEETGYTRKFDGNGLGLALVKSYCDLNKAEVTVESKKGNGTVFRVTFDKKN